MSTRDTTHCEPLPEDELFELFRPRRPDADAFGEAVRRRIAEREELEKRREPERGPVWMRRAAALLPFDPFGAVTGAAAGKLVGTKLLPAALSLPALLLGTALGAFGVGARSLRRSAAEALPAGDRPPRWRSWAGAPEVRRNRDLRTGGALINGLQFLGLALMLLSPLLGGLWAIDALLLVLVLSMGALVVSMRGFARAGLLARPEVARLGGGVLAMVFVSCFLWTASFHVPDAASELGMGWSAGTVLLGACTCFLLSGRARPALVLLVVLVPLLALLNPLGVTLTSAPSLRGQLAALDLDPSDLEGWEAAAALHHALTSTGSELPDLGTLRTEVEVALDAGVDAHPRVWTTALGMGLLDADHRHALARRDGVAYRLERLRAGERPVGLVDYDEFLFWLLRDEDPPRERREALADVLVESWPDPLEHAALSKALLRVRALDLLGLPERVEALRPRAHALLEACWVHDDVGLFGNVGGFTSSPERFRTSFEDTTWDAVRLMERLGAPEGVDLRLLRGHLRTESRAVLFDLAPELQAQSRASLFLLEEGIGLPSRTPLQRVLDERMLLATLLLVVLCLFAIRLAPPPVTVGEHGALP